MAKSIPVPQRVAPVLPPQARVTYWIDVRDHLPDDETTVHCCCETEVFDGYHRDGAWWMSSSDEQTTVTHWADLIEPACVEA